MISVKKQGKIHLNFFEIFWKKELKNLLIFGGFLNLLRTYYYILLS